MIPIMPSPNLTYEKRCFICDLPNAHQLGPRYCTQVTILINEGLASFNWVGRLMRPDGSDLPCGMYGGGGIAKVLHDEHVAALSAAASNSASFQYNNLDPVEDTYYMAYSSLAQFSSLSTMHSQLTDIPDSFTIGRSPEICANTAFYSPSPVCSTLPTSTEQISQTVSPFAPQQVLLNSSHTMVPNFEAQPRPRPHQTDRARQIKGLQDFSKSWNGHIPERFKTHVISTSGAVATSEDHQHDCSRVTPQDFKREDAITHNLNMNLQQCSQSCVSNVSAQHDEYEDIIIHGNVVTDNPHEPLTALSELDPDAANFHQDHSGSGGVAKALREECQPPSMIKFAKLQYDGMDLLTNDMYMLSSSPAWHTIPSSSPPHTMESQHEPSMNRTRHFPVSA